MLAVNRLSTPGAYDDISLWVRAGEVVGIGGLRDSGKSPLGKGIAGVDPPAAGAVSMLGGKPGLPHIADAVNEGMNSAC